MDAPTREGRCIFLCALRLYTMTARTDPHRHRLRLYHARAATIGTGTPHSGRTEPHSEPQRWLPAQCTTPTIGQPQRARVYTANRNTRTGRTDPHSEPQHILPAQSTTPTIGQPQRARVYIQRTGTPTAGARVHNAHTIGAKFPPHPPIVYCIY